MPAPDHDRSTRLGKLARYERESAKADLKRAVELGYDSKEAERLLEEE